MYVFYVDMVELLCRLREHVNVRNKLLSL